MGKALYRSYRARGFDEVIGQDHITKTIETALKNGRLSHAYLLTGPRGVGKTSVARILAHEVNDLPYDKEQPPIDIIEIDAASNRRIDEIRDIKEKANIAPVQAKYKVYIIDEVHMLTRESFNALLKTLEEPPQHVIFILATTELYKLPETIISRCIHFPFKPITTPDIISHLKKIAKSENIKIEDDALNLIAEHGQGSFRDSISLLDQIRSLNTQISINDVRHALGLAPQELVSQLIDCIVKSDIKSLNGLFESLYEFGTDPVMTSRQLLEHVRSSLIDNQPVIDPRASSDLMERLLEVSSSADPKKEFELVLIGACVNNSFANDEWQPTGDTPGKNSSNSTKTEHEEDKHAPEAKKTTKAEKIATKDSDIWQQALQELKLVNNSLYAVVRMAEASLKDDLLTLRFKFAFHNKQVSSSKNLSIIEKALSDAANKQIKVKTVQGHSKKNEETTVNTEPVRKLEHKNISNIFGAGEVLES